MASVETLASMSFITMFLICAHICYDGCSLNCTTPFFNLTLILLYLPCCAADTETQLLLITFLHVYMWWQQSLILNPGHDEVWRDLRVQNCSGPAEWLVEGNSSALIPLCVNTSTVYMQPGSNELGNRQRYKKTSRLKQTQSRSPDAYSLVSGETLVEQWPLVAEK